MPATLDIHPASDAERIELYRNVHEFWGRGLTLDEHVARRLASVHHNRAIWFAGCLDGKVVSSLGCFPLQFNLHGDILPGIAVGAVHTLPDYRGRGFAPQMFEWIEDNYQNAGVKIGLLYSDIDPAYYARLGYIECPSFESWVDVAAAVDNAKESSSSLQQIEARDESSFIQFCDSRRSASLTISIDRDDDYWEFLIQKDASDLFFLFVGASGQQHGYVRIGETREIQPDGGEPRFVWKLRDVALKVPSDDGFCSLLRAAVRTAESAGVSSLGGWMPDTAGVRELADVTPRTGEITMLKSLSPEIELDEAAVSAAMHFQEIDHV